jgi:hypothetical protein
VTHGARCGPKVFAEKAKYYRSKTSKAIGEQDIAHSHSSESTSGVEICTLTQAEGPPNGASETDYTSPPGTHALTNPVKLQNEIDEAANTENPLELGICARSEFMLIARNLQSLPPIGKCPRFK